MKLELKHLAPYLPYGLNMMYIFENGNVWKLDTTNINAITEYDKPILRPLSDFESYFSKLFEECIDTRTFLNEGFITIENQFEDLYDMLYNYKIEWWPYGVIQLAYKHHFDIFGLIEQGLAVDINDLPNI